MNSGHICHSTPLLSVREKGSGLQNAITAHWFQFSKSRSASSKQTIRGLITIRPKISTTPKWAQGRENFEFFICSRIMISKERDSRFEMHFSCSSVKFSGGWGKLERGRKKRGQRGVCLQTEERKWNAKQFWIGKNDDSDEFSILWSHISRTALFSQSANAISIRIIEMLTRSVSWFPEEIKI